MPENEKQLAELEQLKKDYLNTFGSPAGKRVLADLEKRSFVNKSTYSPLPNRTHLNEGIRFAMVYIKNMLLMDIKTLKELAREGD